MASHSAEGTEDKSTVVLYFLLSSESHTQVLISYRVGYRGQDAVLASVALTVISPNGVPARNLNRSLSD